MAHFERTVRSETLYDGKVLRLTVDTVELENGNLSQREVVHHHGGAGIVALNGEGEVYLVRQFRYAFGRELLEIPAGKLEPGEDPQETARRELMEECGLGAGTVEPLGEIYPSVGYDTEVIYLYLAKDLYPLEASPDEDEFLTLEKRPLQDVVAQVMAGEIRDAKTVTAILKVWQSLNP